jgi:hypothetical protein
MKRAPLFVGALLVLACARPALAGVERVSALDYVGASALRVATPTTTVYDSARAPLSFHTARDESWASVTVTDASGLPVTAVVHQVDASGQPYSDFFVTCDAEPSLLPITGGDDLVVELVGGVDGAWFHHIECVHFDPQTLSVPTTGTVRIGFSA